MEIAAQTPTQVLGDKSKEITASSHSRAHGPDSGHRVQGTGGEDQASLQEVGLKKEKLSEGGEWVGWEKGSQFVGHGQFPQ